MKLNFIFKRYVLIVLVSVFSFTTLQAQVYSELNNKPKDTTEYKYLLPIWGKKVKALGFNLPYSAGIGINYLYQDSNIIISNVNIGFNGGDLINVDELIRFNSTKAVSSGINIRPDIWVFPFLNIYGIFARAQSNTKVDVSVVIPRVEGSEELFSIQTSPEFNSTSVGIGLTPTVGLFSGWIALDMNFTWTDIDKQEEPVFAFIFDPRIGKTFNFNKPDQNISVWFGGFRVKVNRDTKGNLALDDVLPINEWNEKVMNGQERVGEAQIELDDWWNSLSPIEQANPVNVVKRESNQLKLNTASAFLNAAENAIDTAGNSTLNYALDKEQESLWNLVVGTQFQYNKHWMIRAEYGFSSGRNTFFTGLQYRFGF